MASPLDAIVAQQSAEPPELPRLTTAQVFFTYVQLGAQLDVAKDKYKAIPCAAPMNCTEHLKDIVKACEAAIAKAQRLLEANR